MARRAGTAAVARRRAALDGWGAEIPKQGVFANNRIAINNRDPNQGSICKISLRRHAAGEVALSSTVRQILIGKQSHPQSDKYCYQQY
jgi:hypothetical protein